MKVRIPMTTTLLASESNWQRMQYNGHSTSRREFLPVQFGMNQCTCTRNMLQQIDTNADRRK